jgi:protein gp37
MSHITDIQWCDSTMNPIMGCGGCELFPSPGKVLASIDEAVKQTGATIHSSKIFKKLVAEVFEHSENAHPGHKKTVNTTNIWHLRKRFGDRLEKDHGKEAAAAAEEAIRKNITCYAAIQHLNKGANILEREGLLPGRDKPREVKPGYAPIFESVTRFAGRSAKIARLKDLLGQSNPKTPWKDRLPRMIFVSDMGDALSAKGDFPFLKSDLMPEIHSDAGKRHLWLWLTKRPERMREFAEEIGGFPENVCAMTTLTGPDAESLKRLADLKKVRASMRGLSIEPLWDRIPPSKLNLKGIDWVIVGGESGSGLEFTRPFALEWAEELRAHCAKHGVAFFLKQLGRNPSKNGEVFRLQDPHGGEWEEWDEPLRIREFPKAFHDYRKDEMIVSDKLRPITKPNPKKAKELPLTSEDKAAFKRLDKIVRKGVEAFVESGKALIEIQQRKLWRAGNHATWEAYCRQVAGLSKSYAHRIINATQVVMDLTTELPIGNSVVPLSESQVRPLLRLADSSQRGQAWNTAVEKAEGSQPTAAEVSEVVFEILHPEGGTPHASPANRRERRVEVFARLRDVVKRKSWNEVELLLEELEGLL